LFRDPRANSLADALAQDDEQKQERFFFNLIRYEKRREKYWSGKTIHVNHSHDEIPSTLAKIEATLKKRNPVA